jgi:hypothetical protein
MELNQFQLVTGFAEFVASSIVMRYVVLALSQKDWWRRLCQNLSLYAASCAPENRELS